MPTTFCNKFFATEPAKGLVADLIAIARDKGIPVMQLHASDAGRTLYENMGFRDTNELRLML